MTISEKFQIIKKACDQRMVCEVHIKNEPLARIVQPIGVCLTIKRGLIVVCKQTEGYSKDKKFPKICNFALDDCERITVLEKKFKMRADKVQDHELCQDWIVRI
jgi:hypothetical protein